jgi:hypothetical protein
MNDYSIWVYAWDLLDEGIDAALDQIQTRGGMTGINVAAIYHSGKFLHVHNPRRRVVFPQSGTLYYRPDTAWHGKQRIVPPVWPTALEDDFWPRLREATARRGMTLSAWTLGLHNSGIGNAYPDTAVVNAYGDRITTDLCAFHPDVAVYLTAAMRDIAANLGVDRVLIESLQHMPFRHGYHHEVIGVPTGPLVDFLLSLDFNPYTVEAGKAAGIDMHAVRSWVKLTLDRHFADPFAAEPQMDWATLRAAVAGEMGAYLDLRREGISTLLTAVVAEIRAVSRARIALCDFGPLYGLAPDERTWEDGVDIGLAAQLVDELHPTFYFTDMEVHRRKFAQYRALLGGEKPMLPAIRAILPQTPSREALRDQVLALTSDAAGFSFYNYGFMAPQVLDWLRETLAEVN